MVIKGDSKMKFFHRMANAHRRNNFVKCLITDRRWWY